MALATALVLLSENDPEAPALPGLASVSKDDDFDDGAFDVGAEAASRGVLWTDRPYATGNPSTSWMLERIDRAVAAGASSVQVLNELNLDLEGWVGGAAAYASYYAELRAARPDAVLLYQPPSPGVPGWQEWVDVSAPALGVHAYGSCAQMTDVVRWFLDNTAGELWITECNPGAGNTFDLNAWAHTELDPFLAWCAGQPRVKMAAYFAWVWDQSGSLPSSVDACGCPAVVDVLRKYAAAPVPPDPPVDGGGTVPEWYPAAVQRPISVNYTPGRGGATVAVLVDHIADGHGSPFNWFNSLQAGASAHFWVSRDGVVEQYRPLSDVCWANGPVCNPDMSNPSVAAIVSAGVDPNRVTVACEHEATSGEALTPAQIDASHTLHVWLGGQYAIPLDRNRVIGHSQLDSCTRANCPGSAFPWSGVLGTAPVGFDVDAARDALWTIAGDCEKNGHPWLGQGVKSAVALSKGDT